MKYSRIRRHGKTGALAILMPAILGLGCSFSNLVASQAPTEAPAELPAQALPTEESCTENPPGLAIQVIPGRSDREFIGFTIKGTGFVAGERLTIRINGQGSPHGYEKTAMDYPVNPDSTFSLDDDMPFDPTVPHWDVHVVHQRGVACLRFRNP